ncbi:small heat shock protein [Candidatus Paraburkholderia kirkii]|nr:small heat shock protein [Candidatus Paraburkholderia kirkii]
MDFRNLIPWNRDRNAPLLHQREDAHPTFALHREMNRLFDDFFRSFDLPARFGSSFGASSGWPNIELSERDKEMRIIAELPGLEKNDVDVSLDNDVLTIRGEKTGRRRAQSTASGGRVASSARCNWVPTPIQKKPRQIFAMAC